MSQIFLIEEFGKRKEPLSFITLFLPSMFSMKCIKANYSKLELNREGATFQSVISGVCKHHFSSDIIQPRVVECFSLECFSTVCVCVC